MAPPGSCVMIGTLLLKVLAGVLLNIYESVDILTLIKGGTYDDLSLSVGEALLKRPDVS